MLFCNGDYVHSGVYGYIYKDWTYYLRLKVSDQISLITKDHLTSNGTTAYIAAYRDNYFSYSVWLHIGMLYSTYDVSIYMHGCVLWPETACGMCCRVCGQPVVVICGESATCTYVYMLSALDSEMDYVSTLQWNIYTSLIPRRLGIYIYQYEMRFWDVI